MAKTDNEMAKMLDDLQSRLDEQDRLIHGPTTNQNAILGGDPSSAAPLAQGAAAPPPAAGQLDEMAAQATNFGGPATYPQVGQAPPAPPGRYPVPQQPPDFPPNTRPQDLEGLDAYARVMGMGQR